MPKKGRWSNKEIAFFKKNRDRLSLEQIALELDRPIETVIRFKDEHFGGDPTQKEIQRSLQDSPEWFQLKYELTEDELKFFEHRFAKIMSQFVDDILPTEETQIFLLIKFEILMSRNLRERKRSEDLYMGLEKRRTEFLKKLDPNNPTDLQEVARINDDMKSIEISKASYTNEYVTLESKHESIMKSLKMTRDQRIKNIENRKKSLVDVIKALEERDFREEQGKYAEMMKKATNKEFKRLSEYHQFADVLDKPIFSADTIE